MKLNLILPLMCMMPMVANAAITYRVEQVKMPAPTSGYDNEAFARNHRFYVGGMYNFAMWQDFTDDNGISINGKNASSFEVMTGIRVFDTFRTELNYVRTNAKWNTMSFDGDTFMINAILDARFDNIYRSFRGQNIVPYVGVGAGLSWNSANDGVKLDKKIAPALAALAGIGFELSDWFALDMGYRYFWMNNPGTNVIDRLNPAAHQFRVGARVNF